MYEARQLGFHFNDNNRREKKNAAREGEGSKKQKTALLLSTECPLSFTQFQCSAVALLLLLLLLPRVVLPLPSGRVKADNSCQKAVESRKETGGESQGQRESSSGWTTVCGMCNLKRKRRRQSEEVGGLNVPGLCCVEPANSQRSLSESIHSRGDAYVTASDSLLQTTQ